jgi:hypothetical protein
MGLFLESETIRLFVSRSRTHSPLRGTPLYYFCVRVRLLACQLPVLSNWVSVPSNWFVHVRDCAAHDGFVTIFLRFVLHSNTTYDSSRWSIFFGTAMHPFPLASKRYFCSHGMRAVTKRRRHAEPAREIKDSPYFNLYRYTAPSDSM